MIVPVKPAQTATLTVMTCVTTAEIALREIAANVPFAWAMAGASVDVIPV